MLAELPLLTVLHEQSRNQPETRIIIREKANHLGSLVNLFVDPFQVINRAHCLSVLQNQYSDFFVSENDPELSPVAMIIIM